MKKWFRRFYIFNKRLYKQASFVAILVLLLLSVCTFSLTAESDSGFVRIVLAQTNSDDAISSKIIKSLIEDDSIILFTYAKNPESAIDAVKNGQADSAWIFPEDMNEKLSAFADTKKNSIVRVVEREQNVFLRLSREKLHSALYNYSAKAFFINYSRENLAQLSNLSDEKLLEFFDNAKISDKLFTFGNPSSANQTNTSSDDYLTAPLRGLLGVITVLGGIAATMRYMQDEQNNTFAWVPQKRRFPLEIGCITVATLNISLVSTIALCASGLYRFNSTELVCVVFYAICCSAFCMLLKQLFCNIKLLGAITPALILIIICVCPVFFVFKQVATLSVLFPPVYYINVSHDSKYILYMIVYSFAFVCLSFVLERLKFKLGKR